MCRIEWADSDGIWFQSPHERTARKDHRCDDCQRTIAKGERYWYGAGLWDGDMLTVKMCSHCEHAARWLRKVCGGHLWPGAIEELQEHWDEEMDLRSLGLGRLLIAANGARHSHQRRPSAEYIGFRGRVAWRDVRTGELYPLDVVDRWVDDALAHVPASAMH